METPMILTRKYYKPPDLERVLLEQQLMLLYDVFKTQHYTRSLVRMYWRRFLQPVVHGKASL